MIAFALIEHPDLNWCFVKQRVSTGRYNLWRQCSLLELSISKWHQPVVFQKITSCHCH